MIEQDGVQYKVNVQERENYEGRPLQVTVSSLESAHNSRYLVYHNTDNLSDAQLVQYLKHNLHVYLEFDEGRQRDYIHYISLQKPSMGGKIELNSVNRNSAPNTVTNKKLM